MVKLTKPYFHCGDVIMGAMASQITGVPVVCLTACSGIDQRKHQSSASLAFVRWIHRWPVDSPHKGPVTRKMFPFDGVIILWIVVTHPYPNHNCGLAKSPLNSRHGWVLSFMFWYGCNNISIPYIKYTCTVLKSISLLKIKFAWMRNISHISYTFRILYPMPPRIGHIY